MRRSDDELDRLAELLAAIPQDQLPMTLGEFDGFATGILACPELIPTSEWLPPVWGDTGDAGFPDIGAAQAALRDLPNDPLRQCAMFLLNRSYGTVGEDVQRHAGSTSSRHVASYQARSGGQHHKHRKLNVSLDNLP